MTIDELRAVLARELAIINDELAKATLAPEDVARLSLAFGRGRNECLVFLGKPRIVGSALPESDK